MLAFTFFCWEDAVHSETKQKQKKPPQPAVATKKEKPPKKTVTKKSSGRVIDQSANQLVSSLPMLINWHWLMSVLMLADS